MKLPAFPRIKFSGVEWLGDVPEHWSVKANGVGSILLTIDPAPMSGIVEIGRAHV